MNDWRKGKNVDLLQHWPQWNQMKWYSNCLHVWNRNEKTKGTIMKKKRKPPKSEAFLWNRDFCLLGHPRVAHRASSNRSFTSPTSTSDAPPTSTKAIDQWTCWPMKKRWQNVNSVRKNMIWKSIGPLTQKKKSGCLFGLFAHWPCATSLDDSYATRQLCKALQRVM